MSRPWRWPVRFGYEITLFVLVSVLDIVMTNRLFRTGLFQESNPVARFFHDHWGIDGLVYFKMAMVAFVVVLTQVIARKRPATARWILHLATAVVSVVVVYSLLLLLRSRGYL